MFVNLAMCEYMSGVRPCAYVCFNPRVSACIPQVHLADRSLMPGDVVRRLIKGRDTQRGYCRQVRVMARVQLVMGGKHVLPCVNSVNLTPLEVRTETCL